MTSSAQHALATGVVTGTRTVHRLRDFLREKDFIHPLSPQQINELRKNIQIVKCSQLWRTH